MTQRHTATSRSGTSTHPTSPCTESRHRCQAQRADAEDEPIPCQVWRGAGCRVQVEEAQAAFDRATSWLRGREARFGITPAAHGARGDEVNGIRGGASGTDFFEAEL